MARTLPAASYIEGGVEGMGVVVQEGAAGWGKKTLMQFAFH